MGKAIPTKVRKYVEAEVLRLKEIEHDFFTRLIPYIESNSLPIYGEWDKPCGSALYGEYKKLQDKPNSKWLFYRYVTRDLSVLKYDIRASSIDTETKSNLLDLLKTIIDIRWGVLLPLDNFIQLRYRLYFNKKADWPSSRSAIYIGLFNSIKNYSYDKGYFIQFVDFQTRGLSHPSMFHNLGQFNQIEFPRASREELAEKLKSFKFISRDAQIESDNGDLLNANLKLDELILEDWKNSENNKLNSIFDKYGLDELELNYILFFITPLKKESHIRLILDRLLNAVTLDDCGALFNISRERVRQLELHYKGLIKSNLNIWKDLMNTQDHKENIIQLKELAAYLNTDFKFVLLVARKLGISKLEKYVKRDIDRIRKEIIQIQEDRKQFPEIGLDILDICKLLNETPRVIRALLAESTPNGFYEVRNFNEHMKFLKLAKKKLGAKVDDLLYKCKTKTEDKNIQINGELFTGVNTMESNIVGEEGKAETKKELKKEAKAKAETKPQAIQSDSYEEISIFDCENVIFKKDQEGFNIDFALDKITYQISLTGDEVHKIRGLKIQRRIDSTGPGNKSFIILSFED